LNFLIFAIPWEALSDSNTPWDGDGTGISALVRDLLFMTQGSAGPVQEISGWGSS
jgi:hypothetical protein